jgi:hypothetical protein
MSILEEIKNTQTTLGLSFATIIVIPFHIIILFSTYVASYDFQTMKSTLGLKSLPVFIGYFILTIVYCALASIFFNPKRIVSPINVQIGTGTTLSIMFIYDTLKTMKPTTEAEAWQIVGNMAGTIFFLIIVLFLVGAFQFFAVRWLVGSNLVGMDRKSYSIDGDYGTIDRLLDFLSVRDLRRQTDIENKIIYKMPRTYASQVLLVLGPDPKNEHHSILATVAYRKGTYSFEKSEYAATLRDSIIAEIYGRLIANDRSYEITPIDKDEPDDPISTWANLLASTPTRSRIESAGDLLEKIPLFYKTLITMTTIALITINIAFWTTYRNFDFNTYVSLTVFLIIALFVEAGIPLREEVFRKKTPS